GPLAERQVLRGGAWQTVRPQRLNFARESSTVGEFAVALLETGGMGGGVVGVGWAASSRPTTLPQAGGVAVGRAAAAPSPARPPRAPRAGGRAGGGRFGEGPGRPGLRRGAAGLLARRARPRVRARFRRPPSPAGPQPLRE